MFDDALQHRRKALRVADLILHVVMIFKNREMTVGIRFSHRVAVLEVVLRAAEFEEAVLLHFPCKRRKRSVFEAVGHLAAHIAIGERLARGDKVGLDGVIVAPHDLFERTALRPVQALDGKVQKRRHHAACAVADLRKLSAVEKRVVDGDFRLRQKRRREVRADGRGHDERKTRDALRCQEHLNLSNFVRLADILLSLAVDGRGRQDAEILLLQISCDWLVARARHAHCVEKEYGRCVLAAKCFKLHGSIGVQGVQTR